MSGEGKELPGVEAPKINPPTAKVKGWKRLEIITHFSKDAAGKQTRKGLDFLVTPDGGVVLSVTEGGTKINLKMSIAELAYLKTMAEYMIGEMVSRQAQGGE